MATKPDTAGLDPSLDGILALLRQRLELDLCVATRRDGDDVEIVATAGEGLSLEPGLRAPWSESICARMAAGRGPRAACRLASVPSYTASPLAQALGVGAYIGAPIMGDEGVIGSVCGLDRRPQGEELARELPLLELCSDLIGRLWQAERDARTDPLTGLANRRAWEEALRREEERCQRFGHSAAVLAVDLDQFKQVNDRHGHRAGDEHLRRAAAAILDGVREHDAVARWGGDEFCVLGVECDEDAARLLGRRVRGGLATAGISASVGVVLRGDEGLEASVDSAFAVVRELKSSRALRVKPRGAHKTPNAEPIGALI